MSTFLQNNKKQPLKSTQELTKVMQYVLAKARQDGATDAVVAMNHNTGFSVDVRMGEVDTVAFSEEKGVSVTVYFGQRKGSASSSDVSETALSAMVHSACEIAKVTGEDPCFGLPDKALLALEYPDLALYHPWDITPEAAIELALSCEKAALGFDKRLVNSDGACVSTYEFCSGLANSQGLMAIKKSTRHGLSCSLIAQEGTSMQSDYDYTAARHPEDLLSAELVAQGAAERALQRLHGRKIKTQKAPVLFSPRVSSQIFSTLMDAINGANLYRHQSFLANTIGQTLFPTFIRVYEQPHLLRGFGSAAYDSEGVATRENVFVDQGVLQRYLLSCYTARKLNLETTANCGGFHNLTIDPTISGGQETLLRQMGTGLLLTELMGQGTNLLTGDYSHGASGFWVEQGQIQYPVEEITVAGHLSNMFQNILAVGDDRNPNLATRCGSVLLKEMMIAGES